MYDLIIIGGGPAGAAAAVYAARKKLKTLIIANDFGGQSVVSEKIYNWIGTPEISGSDLAKNLEKHIRQYEDNETLTIQKGTFVTKTEKRENGFEITGSDGFTAQSHALLVATGSSRKKLSIPGAEQFDNKGVTYCASCDGPLFTDQDVIVVGGGNAGFESAAQLAAYTKSVTILNRSENFKADPITVEKVLSFPNVRAIKNAIPKEILGSTFVESMIYTDALTHIDETILASGVFVEIGQTPSTQFVSNLVECDPLGRVVINPRNQETTCPGIWAAGDCTDVMYHQNNIAAGDAVRAIEDIYLALRAR